MDKLRELYDNTEAEFISVDKERQILLEQNRKAVPIDWDRFSFVSGKWFVLGDMSTKLKDILNNE